MSGCVVLVGAGPGDPDLLTLRAVRELERADAVLYDALLDPAVLEYVRADAERIDVGKRGDGSKGVLQSEIAERLVSLAKQGKYVVRLKGGDPFLFGRGGEEAEAVRAAGLPCEIVPGVSSALAVPAYAGIPVTDRRFASSLAIVTGHRGTDVEDRRVDWEGLARSADTLVVLMGTRWLEDITQRLMRGGRSPDEPAAVIQSGTGPQQRVVQAPLGELAERVRAAGLRAPSVTVVGPVAGLRDVLAWYERRPLFGKRVLVPREGLLSRDLRRRGAQPVCVPLLAFGPPEDPGALARALERPGEGDWLVFTSATAVEACAEALGGQGGRWRVACIGPATARAARAAGLSVEVVPDGASLPETLADAMAARAPLAGRRVVYPKAERVREALVAALTRAGAAVEAVAAYRTELPAQAPALLAEALEGGIDAVALTSGSTAEHLVAALEQLGQRARAEQWIFACIGPTTSSVLEGLGLRAAAVAREQTLESLAAALETAFESRRT